MKKSLNLEDTDFLIVGKYRQVVIFSQSRNPANNFPKPKNLKCKISLVQGQQEPELKITFDIELLTKYYPEIRVPARFSRQFYESYQGLKNGFICTDFLLFQATINDFRTSLKQINRVILDQIFRLLKTKAGHTRYNCCNNLTPVQTNKLSPVTLSCRNSILTQGKIFRLFRATKKLSCVVASALAAMIIIVAMAQLCI